MPRCASCFLRMRLSVIHHQTRRCLDLRVSGEELFLERWRGWHRRVERAENSDRSVEVFERLLLNDRRERFADRAGARVFEDDEDAIAMARDGEHRVAVERRERT